MTETTLAHPNYSGQWELSKANSRLEIAMPDEVVLRIDHDEPLFHIERTLKFGPQTSTFAIDLSIGEENEAVTRGDALVFPSLWWDEDGLVFESKIVQKDELAKNTVRYRLLDDGAMLIADEHYRSSGQQYDNYWVFRKEES